MTTSTSDPDPPLADGTMVSVAREDWVDAILFDEERFLSAFRDLQLDDDALAEDLEDYRHAVEPFKIPMGIPKNIHFKDPDGAAAYLSETSLRRRNLVVERLMAILKRRRFEVVDVGETRIDIPIFRLNAPGFAKSKVTYTEESRSDTSDGWRLSVLGTGMGADQTIGVTFKSAFTVTGKERMVVFAPIPVRLAIVTVYERGKRIGQGLRAEVPDGLDKVTFSGLGQRKGWSLGRDIPDRNATPWLFPVRDTKKTSMASFKAAFSSESLATVKVGVEHSELRASLRAGVRQTHEIALNFELPGGRDYVARHLRGAHGVYWEKARS